MMLLVVLAGARRGATVGTILMQHKHQSFGYPGISRTSMRAIPCDVVNLYCLLPAPTAHLFHDVQSYPLNLDVHLERTNTTSTASNLYAAAAEEL